MPRYSGKFLATERQVRHFFRELYKWMQALLPLGQNHEEFFETSIIV